MLDSFLNKMASLGEQNQSYLLAISGGVDSMVLLDLFIKSKLKIAVAHCNYQLRPEADDETALVAAVCKENDIPIHIKKIDLKKESLHGESTQIAARRVRYDFFKKLRKDNNYHYIVTAHHANDNLETLLLNLTKGTGIRGLVGIAEKSENLIRPMLEFTKQEIRAYASAHSIQFLEDESNNKDVYQRNLLRNKVIPLLKEINPEVESASIKSINNFKFTKSLFDKQVIAYKKKLIHSVKQYEVLYKRQIINTANYDKLLFELLTSYGFNTHQIIQITDLISRKETRPSNIYESENHLLLIDNRERILIAKNRNNPDSLDHIAKIGDSSAYFDKHIYLQKSNSSAYINKADEIFVDLDLIEFPLQIRKIIAGDYFYPFGLGKKKKIAKFLIDIKVNKIEKQQQYIMTSGNKVVWVIGLRADDRFKVTEKTKNVGRIYFE